ncbi:EI24 domain-containing protein [Bacteroidota bacterium]
MNFYNQFFLAFRSYHKAFKYINENKLWKLFLLPSLITLLISLVIGYLAWISSDDIVEYLIRVFEVRNLADSWGVIIEFFLVLLIRGLALFLYLKIYRYFVLFILAPILAYISQRIYCLREGTDFSFEAKVFWKKIARGIVIAFQNLIIEVPLTTFLLFLSLVITWLAPLGPLFVLVVESYFFGLAMIDYRNACIGMRIKESRNYALNNTGLAIGNGLYFNLLLLIPVIGVVIAPILALIAGGMAASENDKNSAHADNIS